MNHDWIFDVLIDLRDYARSNGLTRLAAEVDETLAHAEAEIAEQRGQVATGGEGDTRELAGADRRGRAT